MATQTDKVSISDYAYAIATMLTVCGLGVGIGWFCRDIKAQEDRTTCYHQAMHYLQASTARIKAATELAQTSKDIETDDQEG